MTSLASLLAPNPNTTVLVAAATGVAATDTAAITAAHAALNAGGGTILLRAGAYVVNVDELTFTKPVSIIGMGGPLAGMGTLDPLRAATTIVVNSTTGDALTFTGAGVTLRDFALVNDAATTPTAGTGLKISAASNAHISGVTVAGFWNNIETSGNYFQITGCHVYDPANFGIFLNNQGAAYLDRADLGIVNCVIAGAYKEYTAAAGIRWESGGGIRIIGNKINGGSIPDHVTAGQFDRSIDISVADGVATGDCVIADNSMANFNMTGIRITLKGPTYSGSSFIETIIADNHINSAEGDGLDLGAHASTHNNTIRNISITGNVFVNLVGSSIKLDNCKNVHIGPNVHENTASPLIRIGSGSYGGGVVNLSMDPQNVRSDGVDIVQDWRSMNDTDRAHDGYINHSYRRACHLTSAGTWTTMFTITPWSLGSVGSGGQFLFRVHGHNWGAGAAVGRYERYWTVANNASSPVLTTIGTDITAGSTDWEVQFVTSANLITAQVRLKAGAATADLQAFCELVVNGPVNKLHKGA